MNIGGPIYRLVTTNRGKRTLIARVHPLFGFYGRLVKR